MDDEDRELLQRTADGDDEAFARLYRRHARTVLAFLRARVSTEIAYDLAAESWAQVVIGAGRYRGDGPVIGWVLGIARHKLTDSLRRGQVERAALRRLHLEPAGLDDEDLLRVEEQAQAGAPELKAALDGLAAPVREALIARVVDEQDYPEIATRLGCSEPAARQRVHRGLTRLRAVLERGA